MKIVLIQPPIQDFYETKIRLQPIGLAYLKAVTKQFLPSIEVKIKDYHQGWGRKSIALPAELKFLQDFYPWPDKSPFALFHAYYHFGADFSQIAEEVAQEKPDLVGISCLFSPYYHEVLKTARSIKSKLNIPIIVGGTHVSAAPESILKDPAVDFVIRGEGERPFVELLKSLQNGSNPAKVPNLGFKQNGRVNLNPIAENYDWQQIPWPDFSDFSLDSYRYKGKPLCFIMTSRGCPYDCSFCSIQQTFGKKFRRRQTNQILNEIRFRYEQGYRVFDFEDDNLSFDLKEFKKLCRGLIEIFPRKEVTFLAMNGMCYQNLDKDSLSLMKQAGFTDLNISLVSGNEDVARENKRPHSLMKFEAIVDSAFNLGFNLVTYQILGLPNETINSMLKTLLHISRLPVLIGASPFYLSPGIALAKYYNNYQEDDLLQARLSALGKPTANYEREDIYTLFLTIRIINFLKGLSFNENKIGVYLLIGHLKNSKGRQGIGIDLLEKLLHEKVLYAYTSKGLKALNKFKVDLFFRIWKQLEYIVTQEGKVILINDL